MQYLGTSRNLREPDQTLAWIYWVKEGLSRHATEWIRGQKHGLWFGTQSWTRQAPLKLINQGLSDQTKSFQSLWGSKCLTFTEYSRSCRETFSQLLDMLDCTFPPRRLRCHRDSEYHWWEDSWAFACLRNGRLHSPWANEDAKRNENRTFPVFPGAIYGKSIASEKTRRSSFLNPGRLRSHQRSLSPPLGNWLDGQGCWNCDRENWKIPCNQQIPLRGHKIIQATRAVTYPDWMHHSWSLVPNHFFLGVAWQWSQKSC